LVLDEEESMTGRVGTISDGKDTVIEAGTTSRGNNTTGVVLESSLVSFYSNGNWTLSNSVLETIDTLLWNVRV